MVTDDGILYTIEGVMAGILMITTAYLILSTTSVYTPGETHISDMQLEQLGNDVLAVMDTPPDPIQPGFLKKFIEDLNGDGGEKFRIMFLDMTHQKAEFAGWSWDETINFNASVYYRKNGDIGSYHFSDSGVTGNLTGIEHPVMVTRRVLVNNASSISTHGPDNRNQSVLLEVLMWRD
jgi:hypothetical protein